MEIWMGYRFRGSDIAILRPQLEQVIDLIEARGHNVRTMLKDIQSWDPVCMPKAEAVARAYRLMQRCDIGLFIYPTEDPSEGRGWDAGYLAGLGKPTVMAIHNSLQSAYTEALFTENPANEKIEIPSVIRYGSFEDIAEKF